MRKFLIALAITVAIYSCDNNIANMGQNLIYTDTYIEVERYDLDETSIVRLDSFPTSGQTTLTMGHINDPVTGKTTATPYFQLYRNTLASDLNITVTQAMFDSLTLNFSYKGRLAGDTTTLQTFRVYRLTEYPVLDLDDPYQYNTQELKYDESKLLGQKSFFMQTELMQPPGDSEVEGPYIKLDAPAGDSLGRELFEMMRSQSPIFGGSSTGDPSEGGGADIYSFMRWFKGLVIVPDENNNFLASIGASSSDLYLRCHYHINEVTSYFDIKAMANDEGSYYTFTNVKHEPANELKATNGKQDATNGLPLDFSKNTLKFTATSPHQAVIQGLNGYMLKIKLPYITEGNVYRTIVKAEIQLNTDYAESSIFPQASQLGVYVMDTQGNIDYVLSDMTGDNAILGYFERDPEDASRYRYIIDITDYYITMVESMSTPTHQSMELLIGLPGTLFYSANRDKTQLINGANSVTFSRAVFSELPTLNIYYAEYN